MNVYCCSFHECLGKGLCFILCHSLNPQIPLPIPIAVLLKPRHPEHPTAYCPLTSLHCPLPSYTAFDPNPFPGTFWVSESSLTRFEHCSVCNADLLQRAVSCGCQHRANWVEKQGAKSCALMLPSALNSLGLHWGDVRSTTCDPHRNGTFSKLLLLEIISGEGFQMSPGWAELIPFLWKIFKNSC